MSNHVDPKNFRKRFFAAMSMYWDAVERQKQADDEQAEAFDAFSEIAGKSLVHAVHELATEPRIVCANGPHDFMASDTNRPICGPCLSKERSASIRSES